jgi:uncharacterized lipoprotein NlpE involved in copper resistance
MKNVLFSAVVSALALMGCNNPSEKPTVAASTPVEAAQPVQTPPVEVAKPVEAAKPVEVALPTNTCLVPGALYGMKVGMLTSEAHKIFPIRKTKIKRAEGTVDVYVSAQEESSGDDMDIYPVTKGGKEVIGSIEYTGSCATKEGIKVGSTLADLRKAYPKLKAHGSEMESRVTAEGGGYSFLLNTASTDYNLDQATLKPSVKVKAILF